MPNIHPTPHKSVLNVDVLNDSVSKLQTLLSEKRLTSVDMVDAYLDQIKRHNLNGRELKCVISVAHRDSILSRALKLDLEREKSGARGPMHGIPVLVKVI